MQITFKKAMTLTLKKWRFFSTRDFKNTTVAHAELYKKYPQLAFISSSCGLCHYYNNIRSCSYINMTGCSICALGKADKKCYKDNSLYTIWTKDSSKKNALAMYDMVLTLEEGM